MKKFNSWNFCMFARFWNLIIWTVSAERANKRQNMWWWTAFWCQKETKFDEQWMTRRKIITVWWLLSKRWRRWQDDSSKRICCPCFRWPEISCIEKIWWRKDLMMKKFDDVKFKTSSRWWNNMKTSRCCH